VTLSSRVSCHVRRKGLPPRHAVEVEGLEGLGTPVQRRGRAAPAVESASLRPLMADASSGGGAAAAVGPTAGGRRRVSSGSGGGAAATIRIEKRRERER
jgi:hypothetical protein